MKEKKNTSDSDLEKRLEQLEEKAKQQKTIARKILKELEKPKLNQRKK